MKRDARLRDLSRDHHQALVLARRARAAAEGTDAEAGEAWSEVVRRFHDELAPHFAIEDRWMVPALARARRTDLEERIREEHAELRRLARSEGLELRPRLAAFGALLRDHVRFEERILFQVVTEISTDAELDSVARECADLKRASGRAKHREQRGSAEVDEASHDV